MRVLLISEWVRLWKRKVTWLIFSVIPIIVYAAAKYCIYQNTTITPDLPHYTVMGNFPVLGLSEMLMTAFNLIVLTIVTMVVTDEYRTGQLRMILTRMYSFHQIILAKFIVVLGFIFLYLLTYFIICYAIGYAMFSNPIDYPQFYNVNNVTLAEGVIYNMKFYGLAFLTLVAISSVIFYIAILSHTTTTALGMGMVFLFISFSYPNIIHLFGELIPNEAFLKVYFTSIPMIQWQGLTFMLAKSSGLFGWILLILSCYILLFQLLIALGTNKIKDIFI